MATYEFGTLIRKIRIEKGLSQEQLCDGICSQKTMSQIESGEHLPKGTRFDALMQRLGLSASHYYHVFLGADAFEAFEKQNLLCDLISHRKYDEAEEMITALEQDKLFKTGTSLQFLFNAKATVLLFKHLKYEDALELLYKAIKITKPKFNEAKVSAYLLSFEEIEILNRIATCYARLGRTEEAIKLWFSIKDSIENTYYDEREKSKKYPLIVYNLTKHLGLTGRYEEAIELCRKAKAMCVSNNRYFLYPALTSNELYCLKQMGNIEESKKLITLAYYGYMMTEMHEEMENTIKYAKDNFGMEF